MAASAVKIGGSWKLAANGYVKIDGVWRIIANSYVKTPTGWQQGTLGQPPAAPILAHSGAGKFTIQNYDPSLTYTTARVTGTGTVTQSGSVLTLSDATARFSVTSGYAAGAPQSTPGFVERRPYTYHQEYVHNGWRYWWPPPTSNDCGTWSNGDPWCREPTFGWENVKDATPAGFTDSYGEWARTT